MGKPQSKVEEKIIVQNAPGGINNSNIEEYKYHITTTNILLGVIVLCIVVAILTYAYKLYKKCHVGWITREINGTTLRRSLQIRYRPGVPIEPKLYPEPVNVV